LLKRCSTTALKIAMRISHLPLQLAKAHAGCIAARQSAAPLCFTRRFKATAICYLAKVP
jgi:hypothetical protein